ncbi:major pollen allergen Ole e 10-like [Rhododendron vialii]|uniref:major pollen allergen Ole e 10-like n=1 Tax=Rhododendron vialii TaxID=182163 RepID=UPI00265E5614|nr:major pollen allergen Ole e 10-like [Rhododendron vialii]
MLVLAQRMMMSKQSLAFAVLALTCFLCFTPCTESLAVGNEGKQVGLLVFDVANNYPTKHKIQNHGLNEATANYQKGDPKPVEATASLSTHNQKIPSTASPQPRDKKESENQCRWCIAKPSTSAAKLDEIIQYCCTQYGIDCGVIQYGGACYTPATNKVSDASVVMNLYYNLAGKNDFNCYFGGSGLIVTQDPSVDECFYA